MFRWLALSTLLGTAIAAMVLWGLGLSPNPHGESGPRAHARQQAEKQPEPVKGEPAKLVLPPAVPGELKIPAAPATASKATPIVMSGLVSPIFTQEVPCQREGKLLFIATDVADINQLSAKERELCFSLEVPVIVRALNPTTDQLLPGEKPITLPGVKGEREYIRVREKDELQAKSVLVVYETRWFRELRVGDRVQKGQLLAVVDPALAYDEVRNKVTSLDAKEADRAASEKTREEAAARLQTAEKLYQNKAMAAEEYRGTKLTYERYVYEEIGKGAQVRVASRELAQALTVLRMHQIRSEVNGVIKSIYRKRGESVKNLDPVMQIHNQEDLRLEAHVDVQFLPKLAVGSQVVVEPTTLDGYRSILTGHLQEVNAVAVSKDKDTPLIFSASEDGTVRVWDYRQGAEAGPRYTHSTAVKAVACTGPASEANLCLFGCQDGSVRLWDINKLNELPIELSKVHKGAVTCVAFTRDGKAFATGGEDHGICVWTPSGNNWIPTRLPKGHNGGLTSLQFTASGKLISAARDNTLLIWEADITKEPARYNRRSGTVPSLGVRTFVSKEVDPTTKETKDVLREDIFFDRGRELRLLSLDNGRTDAVLQNLQGASDFTVAALCSSDGKLALTANGSDARLQLWRLPNDSVRASELRQYVWNGAPTTCLAFAPHSSEQGFAVTGTKDGQVVLWQLPTAKEVEEQLHAEIVLADNSLESGSRQVRVWAHIKGKPERPLTVGNTATMVVYPK